MFGRAWGGSQANDGFCWDVDWASQAPPAPQQAPGPQPRLQGAPRVTLEPPPSRSGVAALSAQRATHNGVADPFSFNDDPPGNPATQPLPKAAGVAASGWRERSNAFLLGAPAPPRHQHQHLQPTLKPAPPAPASRKPATQPAKATAFAAAPRTTTAAAAAACPTGKPAQPAAATAAVGPPATCSLSLEQYLEFWQLLSKGSGRVQALSELERGMLKAADLKQVLLVQGINASSRTKKEILDWLGSLQLFSPLCLAPCDAAASISPASPQPSAGSQVQLDLHALGSLGSLAWEDPEAVRPCARQCAASCCALPPVHIHAHHDRGQTGAHQPAAAPDPLPAQHLRQHFQEPRTQGLPGCVSVAAAEPAQPTDSQTTVASWDAAARQHNTVQCSPSMSNQQQQQQQQYDQGAQREHRGSTAACVTMGRAVGQQATVGVTEEEEEEEGKGAAKVPEWLLQGLAEVAQRSQGSREPVTAAQLLGRRICFVLLDQFDQSDARGIVDSLEAGVQEGQVVEAVGVDHDDDCPPGCSQRHAFHYVRVRAARSTAPPARRSGRRLDLVVDLQQGLRQLELRSLLGMADAELQEAWVLLEPRAEDAEQREGTHVQQRNAAVAATLGAGHWRTKRAAQAPAVPIAKRQQSGGGPH